MEHLHYQLNLAPDAAVKVTLANQANVKLMDNTNYQYYLSNRPYKYFGGLVKHSPFVLNAPHAGSWHVAIDLGGYSGKISASVAVI